MTTWLSVVVRRMEGRSVTTSPTPLASKPSNPWRQFYMASLPTYKERFPSLKNSEIIKKVVEEWKMISKEEKAKMAMVQGRERELVGRVPVEMTSYEIEVEVAEAPKEVAETPSCLTLGTWNLGGLQKQRRVESSPTLI